MDPQIRYCTTSDGVSIAYWTIGDGTTIVDMGHPPTHAQMEWRLAPMRAWYERFARHHRYVRLDTRGCGLSERNISEYSLDTMVRDVEAVIDDLGCETVTLIGGMNSGAPAIAYAARHPERLERLILWCAYSKGTEFFDDPGTKALRDLVDRDWHMLTETASRSRFMWKADDHASEYATLWRSAVTPRVQGMLMDGLAAVDVTPLLQQVRAPTLVLHREDRGVDLARRIAAGIPGAKIALFTGGSAAPYLPDADDVWRAIADFLGDDATPIRDGPALSDGTAVILFTDIVDSTPLTERLGDTAFRAQSRDLDAALRAAIEECGGTPVEGKVLGDGVMAVFASAARAIEAAVRCGATASATGLQLHLGLHAGDVIREAGNVYGGAVNIASRIAAASGAGEILVSDTVRALARTSSGVTFEDRGEHALKGIDDPVRLYKVRVPE